MKKYFYILGSLQALTAPGSIPAGLILGIILSLWIIIQVMWITLSSFLQPLFLIIGIAEIFLGLRLLRTKSVN